MAAAGMPVGAMRPGPMVAARMEPAPALGWLLTVPAAVFALLTLVVPTGQTIVRAIQNWDDVAAARRQVPRIIGDDPLTNFWSSLGFSLSLAVIPLLVAVVVAPLLAAALDGAGTVPRRAARVLMSVPLVVFSPVAVAVAWAQGQHLGPTQIDAARHFFLLSSEGEAPWAQRFIIGGATLGVVCGLALLGYLAVFRGRADGRKITPAMVAVGAIIALATIAVSLQEFSFSWVWETRRSRGQTLGSLQNNTALRFLDSGAGAVIATGIGLLLAVLGVAATLVAIKTRLRLRILPADKMPARVPRAVGGFVAVAAVLIVGCWALLPWLSALFSSNQAPPLFRGTLEMYVNTWVPPLLGAIISVGVAYLAALGIGGVRPLGRGSEWLLLPFAPWLFVGLLPLAITDFENVRDLNLLDSGLLVRIPPILVSVPALVILTLFFRGQSAAWRARPRAEVSFQRAVALPALPLAGLLAGAMTVVYGQSALWSLFTPRGGVAVQLVLRDNLSLIERVPRGAPVGLATPLLVVVIALIGIAVLQVRYLDRLAIIAGGPDDSESDEFAESGDGAGRPGQPAQPYGGHVFPPPFAQGPSPYGQGPPYSQEAPPYGQGPPPVPGR
jgi:hypothetical protein